MRGLTNRSRAHFCWFGSWTGVAGMAAHSSVATDTRLRPYGPWMRAGAYTEAGPLLRAGYQGPLERQGSGHYATREARRNLDRFDPHR